MGVLLFAGLLVLAAGELETGWDRSGRIRGRIWSIFGVHCARWRLWGGRAISCAANVWGAGVGWLSWRYALASLERRSGASALQITALGIGLMCLLAHRDDAQRPDRGLAAIDAAGRTERISHRCPA